MKRAFSLVELMIVIAMLGILAAIVVPQFQSHSQQAKEAAAKDNLRILRNLIELYAARHNGIPPGYGNNDPTVTPLSVVVRMQLVEEEKYLSKIPENPFNNSAYIYTLPDDIIFPAEPTDTDTYGWIYKPASKAVKLNWPGTDTEGVPYFDY